MDNRFEVIESDPVDYLAVLDFTDAFYCSVESYNGGYIPRVYQAHGLRDNGLDDHWLVSSGEKSRDREQAAADAVRLAASHCRLMARACEAFPVHMAITVEV